MLITLRGVALMPDIPWSDEHVCKRNFKLCRNRKCPLPGNDIYNSVNYLRFNDDDQLSCFRAFTTTDSLHKKQIAVVTSSTLNKMRSTMQFISKQLHTHTHHSGSSSWELRRWSPRSGHATSCSRPSQAGARER